MIGELTRTLLSRLLLFLIMVILFIPTVIVLCLPERLRYDNWLVNKCKHFFYWSVIKASFLPITIIGQENIPQEPVIIVANHQSSLDIPLIGYLVKGFPHVWLATKDLMKSPILRWILPRVTVLVDIGTPMKGMRSLIRAVSMVCNRHRHVIIFPEGGRYTDGSVHDFYSGFAILAKKAGRPVVPVRIFGVHKVYPPEKFIVQYHPITLIVGEPMFRRDDETDEAFKERVYQWFVHSARE
jgi:1-acyl-sn-glycerol-3-phosphate acyltransferase